MKSMQQYKVLARLLTRDTRNTDEVDCFLQANHIEKMPICEQIYQVTVIKVSQPKKPLLRY